MSALILIDFQQAFDHPTHWGPTRNDAHAEDRALRLLRAWRGTGRRVIHVRHDSTDPASILSLSQPGGAPMPGFEAGPGEVEVIKHVNSAFIGTDLEQRLRRDGVTAVTICGLTTDHCVSTSTRMAGNLGFAVTLAADACATFDRTGPDGRIHPAQTIHDTAIASLHGEFAQARAVSDILEDLA